MMAASKRILLSSKWHCVALFSACLIFSTIALAQAALVRYEGTASTDSRPAPLGATRHITLEEAEQQADAGKNPLLARLAQLQIEAAKQHRLGTESDFFPKIGATLLNTHFNKFMGQLLQVARPALGTTSTVSLPLAGKDQTFIAANAAQPITPLFKLRQVYNIARADERIAMAKAGMPVSSASLVEKNYYELLVAQKQLALAKINSKKVEDRWLVASNAAPNLAGHEEELLEMSKALAIAANRVEELTVDLNGLLGWPAGTKLELETPAAPLEDISLQEATDKAMAASVEVAEAEQNAAKARAASALSKLEYVPYVVVTGGYAYNGNALPLLPRDFTYIGLLGSYTLFDFGKREHGIKERKAQVGMAETALQLTKAKVAAGVKTSYFELQGARQLSDLTRRMASATQALNVSAKEEGSDAAITRAKIEMEMLQADLKYRQAISQMRSLMGYR